MHIGTSIKPLYDGPIILGLQIRPSFDSPAADIKARNQKSSLFVSKTPVRVVCNVVDITCPVGENLPNQIASKVHFWMSTLLAPLRPISISARLHMRMTLLVVSELDILT